MGGGGAGGPHPALGCDGPGMSAFLLGLFTGTFSTITIKVAYEMQSVGLDGETVRPFEKPLTTTWFMFLAMAMAIPAMGVYSHLYPPPPGEEPKPINWKLCFLVLIPSVFDMVGTALAKVGLLYCTVSVYQLVRCTVIIITALLKAFVLKDRLDKHMWLGVGINLVAMCLVSATTFFDKENQTENRDPRVGVVFILLSCLVQGTQYVFEEKVMAVDGLPPMWLIGLEGLWGMALMLFLVFPLAYWLPGTDAGGCVENVWDSLAMVKNSRPLQLILLAFFISVAAYNIFAIYVTHFLSSVWHAILDNFRPVSVWGTDLLIYYVLSHGAFGEAWTPYSWLQLSGMLLLFFGTAVYNGSIPWLIFEGDAYYSAVSALEEAEKGAGGAAAFATPPQPVPYHRRGRSASIEDFLEIRTDPNMASPALMRSPLIRDRSDPRVVRERGASLYGTPRADRSGSAGGGGLRVGSYTPASYGSVTTFAPSSYQYRSASAQPGAAQPTTITLIQPQALRKAESHDGTSGGGSGGGGFVPSSSLPTGATGAAGANASASPPNGAAAGGAGRGKKKKRKGKSPPRK